MYKMGKMPSRKSEHVKLKSDVDVTEAGGLPQVSCRNN